MILEILLCAAGVGATLGLHFATVSALFKSRYSAPTLRWATLAAFVLLLAHLVEIAIYACLYRVGAALALGHLNGDAATTAGGHFYFSATTFTTVGFGDVTPSAGLRVLTAVEALNGIVLVGVTTSAMLVIMSRAVRNELNLDRPH